jgi:hypothetical protein
MDIHPFIKSLKITPLTPKVAPARTPDPPPLCDAQLHGRSPTGQGPMRGSDPHRITLNSEGWRPITS